jgi:hypothetical protein
MARRRRRFAGAIVCVLTAVSTAAPQAQSPPKAETAVLVGAGDIADCRSLDGAFATAKLLDAIPGTVFTTGDNAYPNGTAQQFAECYGPTWGRHRARTRPAVGNHDYHTTNAAHYFAYFGAAAGEPGKGYYSYDLGAWHVIVLNSHCAKVGCEPGSPQERWLREDLASRNTACSLAYFHHPRFTSGVHGNSVEVTALWQALYEAGVELAIGGHDHDYERFAPQTAAGLLDRERGVRQFVAGTGGKKLRRFSRTKPNSEVRSNASLGVLKLTLRPRSYDWEFVPVAGGMSVDSGTDTCH